MFDNRYYKFFVDPEFKWNHFDAVVDYPNGDLLEDSADFGGIKDGQVVRNKSSYRLGPNIVQCSFQQANMLDADVSIVKFLDIEDE